MKQTMRQQNGWPNTNPKNKKIHTDSESNSEFVWNITQAGLSSMKVLPVTFI